MNAYEYITERIVAMLERGTIPWQKPWQVHRGWPQNLITKKPYRGINVFLLLAMDYESPFWLTFRQTLALGGSVRKGEKACPVVFWKPKTIKDRESGEEKKIPLLRFYHVFNVAQCDGIGEEPQLVVPAGLKAAEIVSNMPQRPAIKHGLAHAFYSVTQDFIGMPARERFNEEDEYYSTLFHELIHSTGHESRLKRATLNEKGGFGSDPYCREELIAEMGAAFLCGHSQIIERTIDSSAAYLSGWLERLKADKTLIVHAAAQAQKAADFVLGVSPRASSGNEHTAVRQGDV
ncbi:MAG TPA: zincin-like metallopeptidase domain-containing protein [Verrucomicrobiae bacterium]|jgi:antirestriction protein ArdC|nr:zincin-like metallopeptidase domain-containing protein [Verrucomicrobiae bacterium]